MKKRLLFRDAFLCLILSVVGLSVFSLLIFNLSVFNPFLKAFKDFAFTDLYYSERFYEPTVSRDIIVVNIDQRERYELFELLNHIQKQNPKVIGLDVIFREEKDDFIDSLLAVQTGRENVVQAKAFIDGRWQYDYWLDDSELPELGYTNINFESTDNVIRSFEAVKTINGSTHYSLALAVAKKYLRDNDRLESHIQKRLSKPNYIRYIGNSESFLSLSYDEVMSSETIEVMKDKIVLLGYTGMPHFSTTDVEDKFFTPLNEISAGKSIPDMFGVLIHANIINMMLTDNYMWTVPSWLIAAVSLIFAYFSISFFIWLARNRPEINMLTKKIVQLILSVILLWLSLWLYKNKIVFKPEYFIVFVILSVEFIGLYIFISKKLNTKYQWKSYFHN